MKKIKKLFKKSKKDKNKGGDDIYQDSAGNNSFMGTDGEFVNINFNHPKPPKSARGVQ